jgi:hypothetical protein
MTAAQRRNAFEQMVLDGYLDESDAYEVGETIELLAERYAQGDISEHFAQTVIRKLADEGHAKYLRRWWGPGSGREGLLS